MEGLDPEPKETGPLIGAGMHFLPGQARRPGRAGGAVGRIEGYGGGLGS